MTVRVSDTERNVAAGEQVVPVAREEVTLLDVVAEIRRDSRLEASSYLSQAVSPFGGE